MSTDQAENIQERNKEIVARYWDALYSHDWDVIASFFTDTANYVDTGTGESMGGAHGPDEIVARLYLGLDPVQEHNHVEGRMIAEDHFVVTEHAEEWVFHTGERIVGGFKWSSQHLDVEVCDGQAVGVVGEADGETGDEVAGASADSSGCGAGVLGEDRRGAHKRGRGDRVRGVGFRRIALVPRTWGNANSRAGSVYGALPVLQ